VKDVACGSGTAHPSGALEFSLVFSEVRVVRSVGFCVVYCLSLFVLLSFFFSIVLVFLLQFTASDCPFFIFTLHTFLVSCEMITYQSRVIKERCLIEVIMVICQ
jgi:hypothetical protein